MKTTTLKQSMSFFNPPNAGYSEHCENCRWFNDGGSNNDYPEIQFPFEIVRKREFDLTRNFAYFTNYKAKYSMDKGKIVVFIPIQLLENYREDKNVWKFDTDTEKHYMDYYYFDVVAVKKQFKINDLEQVEYFNGAPEKHTLNFHGFYNTVKTNFGEKVSKVESKLKEAGVKISGYELEQLMKVYELKAIV